MAVLLPEVRYYTPADPYNYAVDNRPIYDLAQGQAVLKAAVETVAANQASAAQGQGVFSRVSSTGTWPLSLSIDLSTKLNSVWAVKLILHASRNLVDASEGSVFEQVIFGTNSGGVVLVAGSANQSVVRFGTLDCELSATPGGTNSLVITVSGSSYLGTGKISGAYTIC